MALLGYQSAGKLGRAGRQGRRRWELTEFPDTEVCQLVASRNETLGRKALSSTGLRYPEDAIG